MQEWAFKWRVCPYVVWPTASWKLWIYQVLTFIVIRDIPIIGNKISDREFYRSVDHEFDCGLQIANCKSTWSAYKFVRQLLLVHKNENSLWKNIVALTDYFLSKWKSSKNKKETPKDEGSDAKFYCYRSPAISFKVT